MRSKLDMKITPGTSDDIDGIEALYNDLNDYLASHENYAGWRRGVYPTGETAENAIRDNSLYVAKLGNRSIGTIILNHVPEPNYDLVRWPSGASMDEVFVIHTLAVHPDYKKKGIGRLLLGFSYDLARKEKMKALRLDVNDKNKPAIKLYEDFGFSYADTIDIGLGAYGLPWFRVYEMAVI